MPKSKFAPWQLERLPAELREPGVMLDSQNSGQEFGKRHRLGSEPAVTVIALDRPSHMPRAFICDGQGATERHGNPTMRQQDEPMFTVVASVGRAPVRAFLVTNQKSHDQEGNEYDVPLRSADQPAMTVRASQHNSAYRAWLAAGRVVKMTSRALARFQSVPDTFILPDKDTLATLIIGNGVACRMFQTVIGDLAKVAYGN